MLPATLVTLVTFVLDLSGSSPVYNMHPAFITTNIGSTNGRNIRNLPCVSRKNSGLSGVCMFAIDCLKQNGTHLGTCIDRFYFGSCCHIEPIKQIENIIETNIILDTREPPERVHNTTSTSTSTQSSLSSSTSSVQINKISKIPISATTESYSSTERISTPKTTVTIPPSPTIKPISTARPFGDKIPTTIEVTTTAQKLQTFQIIDGSLLETTTFKPAQPTKRPSGPVKTSTKHPATTTRPRPAITAPSKPYQKPSKPSSSTSKPSSRPNKPSSSIKPTPKPSKPVKVGSTTKKPYSSTTGKPVSTRRTTTTTKPTKRVTKPVTIVTSVKPVSTTQKTIVQTTTTKRPPTLVTKRPSTSSTTSSPTTRSPTTIPSTVSTATPAEAPVTSQSVTSSQVTVASSTMSISEEPLSKKNVTQILESAPTVNPTTNEVIIESSGVLTVDVASHANTSTTAPVSSSSTAGSSTVLTSIIASSTTTSPSSISQSTSTSTVESSAEPGVIVTTTKPISPSGIVTWTVEDSKNHTVINDTNETVASGNFTEDWVPITTPDGWVLLPSVTPITMSPSTITNDTTIFTTSSPVSSIETISTFIPLITPSPETQATDISSTTVAPSSTVIPNISSITTEGDNLTTSIPIVTESPGNVSSITEDGGSTTVAGITGSVTSTEVTNEVKPVNMSDFTDVCGRRMWPEARIVGGEKSAFGRWPWQISLRQWRTSTYLHKCGAALLNENWAITAAHCVDNVSPSDLLLRLGEHDLSTEGEPFLHEERRVQIVASHPQFDPRTFEYDLALLRFYEPVQFQPNILPVCVPKTDENFVGRTAYVTGWGRLYEDGPLPSILQEVSVPVINNSVCESMYRSAGYIEHIPHIFICAGWRRGGFDSCEGDSGGPMVIQREDKRFLLAGVISWGIGCAEPNQPGVYTRISEFRDWINQILQF